MVSGRLLELFSALLYTTIVHSQSQMRVLTVVPGHAGLGLA